MKSKMAAIVGATVLCVTAPAIADDRYFGGNECTEDCTGHAAGFRWAEENSVSDPSDCNGNSNSFDEGCQTFVDEPSRGADEDDAGIEIDQ